MAQSKKRREQALARMAEVLKDLDQERNALDKLIEPDVFFQDFVPVSELPPGSKPLQPLIDRIIAQNKRESDARRDERKRFKGYQVRIPNTKPIRHLFFKAYTPQAVIDKISKDWELLEYARQWSAKGGNQFAALMYEQKLLADYDMAENPNYRERDVNGRTLGYGDFNHYFDWKAWKAEYNRQKG